MCHVHFPVSSPTLVLLSVSFFAYKFGDPNSKALFHLWSVTSEISENYQRQLFWIMGVKNINLTNVKHYLPSVGDFFLVFGTIFFGSFYHVHFWKIQYLEIYCNLFWNPNTLKLNSINEKHIIFLKFITKFKIFFSKPFFDFLGHTTSAQLESSGHFYYVRFGNKVAKICFFLNWFER